MMTLTSAGLVVRPAVPGDAEGIVALLDAVAREGSLGVPQAPRRAAEERAALAAVPPSLGRAWVAVAPPAPAGAGGPAASGWGGPGSGPAGHGTPGSGAGAIVGHLLAARGPGPYRDHLAEVAVAVAPGHRKQGVGGTLLDEGLAWALAHRLLKVCASVLAENAPALRLFASRGFTPEGTRRGQFRIEGVSRDEVFLARILG